MDRESRVQRDDEGDKGVFGAEDSSSADEVELEDHDCENSTHTSEIIEEEVTTESEEEEVSEEAVEEDDIFEDESPPNHEESDEAEVKAFEQWLWDNRPENSNPNASAYTANSGVYTEGLTASGTTTGAITDDHEDSSLQVTDNFENEPSAKSDASPPATGKVDSNIDHIEASEDNPRRLALVDACLVFMILVAVVVIVTALPLTLMNRSEQSNPNIGPTNMPTRSPSSIQPTLRHPTSRPILVPASPSKVPVQPTSTTGPTESPSSSPLSILQWNLGGGPFSGSPTFANSVTMTSNVMAAGDISGNGLVQTFTRANTTWTDFAVLYGTQLGSQFGASTSSHGETGLLVGSPGLYAEGTITPTGAAYYYTLSGSSWNLTGGTIRGDSNVFAANEDFGAAVAVSGNPVLAIGAPRSNYGNVLLRGRVYTFVLDLTNNNWIPRERNATILGDASNCLLGSSVDVAADGSTLVTGAPGSGAGAGACLLYTWQDSDWNNILQVPGNTSGDSFGESVAILASDGSFIACGGSGYDSGKGIIRVYRRTNELVYEEFGRPIIGENSDALGSPSSVSGMVDSSGVPVILSGTSRGDVRTYQFNASEGTWDQAVPSTATNIGEVPAISGSKMLRYFVAGKGGTASIFSLS